MNERIRELATEVGMSVEYLESTKQIVLIERFAELIVRECMSNLYLHGYDDAAKCLQDIHFGIDYPV